MISPLPEEEGTPAASPSTVPTPTQAPPPTAPEELASASPPPADGSADVAQTDEIEAGVDWQAFVPNDTADHLATMDRVARESNCGVPWQLLAAIARVESDFGRNMATSSAGAIGYGQFLPSSWQTFGSEGNAYDYRDALPAIALYLCQAGLEQDPRAALFAYNHADWYVDLVLNLAVRYDRMAPGAPTPDVLDVGPAREQAAKMQYAPGRDLRVQTRARLVDGDTRWLGVPWRGRAAGQPIAARALGATTLNMLCLGFGLKASTPAAIDPASSRDLHPLVDAAWSAGMLSLPAGGQRWTVAELRQNLRLGRPVVVFVGSRGLPGHPANEDDGEQPLALVGATSDGFIYNDPTFSSSLGYGLEISEVNLLTFWDAAARPRQALAFVPQPKPLARQAHIADAQPPDVLARQLPTATPLPTETRVPVPTALPTAPPTLAPTAVPTPVPVAAASESNAEVPVREWAVLAVAAVGVFACALVFGLRRLRDGPSR